MKKKISHLYFCLLTVVQATKLLRMSHSNCMTMLWWGFHKAYTCLYLFLGYHAARNILYRCASLAFALDSQFEWHHLDQVGWDRLRINTSYVKDSILHIGSLGKSIIGKKGKSMCCVFTFHNWCGSIYLCSSFTKILHNVRLALGLSF